MQKKAFVLQNKGMNRDLSVSKTGESSAYENHNIRIVARDHDTLLSVTNERGNKQISLGSLIQGELVGWNVLNEHVILFTHEGETDRIYRIDYKPDGTFEMKAGSQVNIPLYEGSLGFSLSHPIESVVYQETEKIKKIYWVDGVHVLRFMNFMAEDEEIASWQTDETSFDTNRPARFTVTVEITKDNAGNARANGVVQYFLSYFNKHGQETGYVWASDLVYLSPVGIGGAADDDNNNRVLFTIKNLDQRYTNFRLYSIFRSSYNGQVVSYLVHEGYTAGGEAQVVDDGAHLVVQDSTRLLFLGSKDVRPGTLAHKDQTLFLGDLQATVPDYDNLNTKIKSLMFSSNGWESSKIEFDYSDGSEGLNHIPLHDFGGRYSYENQLIYSSSNILTFKGGEKYRFALVFRDGNGMASKAFWVGDLVNDKYPEMDMEHGVIKRVIARCSLPDQVIAAAKEANFVSVQLMIAEATYADRSIKAQGILNPTMFNVWERYNSRLYACPSWIFRPRNTDIPSRHFDVVHNSNTLTGEIQCNYWETEVSPAPYFRIVNYGTPSADYEEEFDGNNDFDYLFFIYGTSFNRLGTQYTGNVLFIRGRTLSDSVSAENALKTFVFDDDFWTAISTQMVDSVIQSSSIVDLSGHAFYTDPEDRFELELFISKNFKGSGEKIFASVNKYLIDTVGLYAGSDGIIDDYSYYEENLLDPLATSSRNTFYYFNPKDDTSFSSDLDSILNKGKDTSGTTPVASVDRWYAPTPVPYNANNYYEAAYYKKHLMFVDENLVTLNSPEIEYEAVSFDSADSYKLRIIGVARITENLSDYTVVATHGKRAGENLVRVSNTEDPGFVAWPLWTDYSLSVKRGDDVEVEKDIKKRDSSDYTWGHDVVHYWLYMWNHVGIINGYRDADENNYSLLQEKTFANLRFCETTLYGLDKSYDLDTLRVYDQLSSRYINVNIGNDAEHYDGNVQEALSMPGTHKYPLLFSRNLPNSVYSNEEPEAYLYSNSPIQIEFNSRAHAVLSLKTEPAAEVSGHDYPVYRQVILPSINGDGVYINPPTSETVTGNLIPWEPVDTTNTYPFTDYVVDQEALHIDGLDTNSTYFLVGEIYYDYDDPEVVDNRYGGTSDAALENNRFIPAGPEVILDDEETLLYGNQGDTYFQRWDCLKTSPVAAERSVNGVIDIASVMLETHINIDGRTDKQRGTKYLASIDTAQWGTLNRVYSQDNNYFVRQILDEDFDLAAYRSSVTWTLQKADSADVDEWTHVTLATHLKLDGDKGFCRAIRRIQNSLIAFQDRGISEILFNSRTQLTTTDGVPIEIANSGKVDGKRYITNKYGCINKWSIVEGKNALYFVDNINKAFCRFASNVENLSTQLGFGVWFRLKNDTEPWNPGSWNNFVSFFDRIHSDVYVVKAQTGDEKDPPALVFNEPLGVFTSFFDYGSVPMMSNVKDKFVSFWDRHLWLQNEGAYCNFFGTQYDFWMQYRVTPEPYGDKIWTNIEYRADFYRVLSGEEEAVPIEPDFTDDISVYQPYETFDFMRFWNEYQTTENKDKYRCSPIKKFRIWRLAIPRAVKNARYNPHGLDRIRNPWLNLLFRKSYKKTADETNQDLMQLHDMTVIYFE